MTYLDFTSKDFYIAAKEVLLSKGSRVELAKGEYLCQVGEKDNKVGLLTNGAIKYSRFTTRGHERIVSFAFTGDLVGSYSAMRNDAPSPVDIIALENSVLYQMSIHQVDMLMGIDLRMKLGEAVAHKAMLEAIDSCCRTPEERYLALSRRFPDIHNRLTNRTIASFLGITPESLSRLCKRLLTKQP